MPTMVVIYKFIIYLFLLDNSQFVIRHLYTNIQ